MAVVRGGMSESMADMLFGSSHLFGCFLPGNPRCGRGKGGRRRGIGPRRQPPTQPGQYQISFEGLFPEPNLYWMILRDMTVSRSTFLSAEELL